MLTVINGPERKDNVLIYAHLNTCWPLIQSITHSHFCVCAVKVLCFHQTTGKYSSPSVFLHRKQRDFSRREELQQSDVEQWLGFITFLCEVFGTMRSSSGDPFRVLVCPIYTCLREVSILTHKPLLFKPINQLACSSKMETFSSLVILSLQSGFLFF